ncbi:MAG: hypothetical protein V5A31_13060 [Haloferacaceae archaeon]|jgi:hypothetical protein
MCLDKFPVEFDAEGNARLADTVDESGDDFLDDVAAPADDLAPEERFGAVVADLPDHAVQHLDPAQPTQSDDDHGCSTTRS